MIFSSCAVRPCGNVNAGAWVGNRLQKWLIRADVQPFCGRCRSSSSLNDIVCVEIYSDVLERLQTERNHIKNTLHPGYIDFVMNIRVDLTIDVSSFVGKNIRFIHGQLKHGLSPNIIV